MKISKKNRLIEEMLDEKLLLEALRCYHRKHLESADFNPYGMRGNALASDFSDIEKRLAKLTGIHTAKFVQLNRKINRKLK